MVVQVHVVNNLPEGFITNLAVEINDQFLIGPPVLLKVGCEVRRLLGYNALMCRDLHLWDKYLFLFSPVALRHLGHAKDLVMLILFSIVPLLLHLLLLSLSLVDLLLLLVLVRSLVVRLRGLGLTPAGIVDRLLLIV